MTTRYVKWTSPTLLACAECSSLEQRAVILCVTPSKVAEKTCPLSGEDQPYPYSTVEAIIYSYYRSSIITPPSWEYLLSYDDSQLVSGAVLLPVDISGMFCDGCFAEWARELVGDETYIYVEGEGYVFVSQHGCEYPFDAGSGLNPIKDFIFGNGADGDLTVLNGEDLVLPVDRNMYFDNLTIDDGGQLRPLSLTEQNHYQIFVRGTLTINGTLGFDANNGTDASGSTPGVKGEMQGARSSFGPGGADDGGGDGGRGQTALSSQDGDECEGYLAATGVAAGGHGGAGGAGGDGSAGGVASDELAGTGYPLGWAHEWKEERHVFWLVTYGDFQGYIYTGIGGGAGGAGGGGGARVGGNAAGGGGGGGGAGAGCVYAAARNIVIGATGKVAVNGGDGGDGADGVIGTGTGAGGGGGGAGGGGGFVYLVYEDLVNSGIIEVNGGAAGAAGSGVGTSANGVAGEAGHNGNIELFNMTTGIKGTP